MAIFIQNSQKNDNGQQYFYNRLHHFLLLYFPKCLISAILCLFIVVVVFPTPQPNTLHSESARIFCWSMLDIHIRSMLFKHKPSLTTFCFNMPVISRLAGLIREENCKYEDSLGYIMKSRPVRVQSQNETIYQIN